MCMLASMSGSGIAMMLGHDSTADKRRDVVDLASAHGTKHLHSNELWADFSCLHRQRCYLLRHSALCTHLAVVASFSGWLRRSSSLLKILWSISYLDKMMFYLLLTCLSCVHECTPSTCCRHRLGRPERGECPSSSTRSIPLQPFCDRYVHIHFMYLDVIMTARCGSLDRNALPKPVSTPTELVSRRV
jgi:hypothetical protein